MLGEIRLFTGNANPALAESIAAHLGRRLSPCKVGKFSDLETRVEIQDNVRGRDVFVIQPTCSPANEHLMELLILGDACKRASAGRLTAVIPYYGYARQDRKVAARAPITAKLVADLIQAAGFDRVLTMDLHAGQIQGFFDIPVDNLYSLRELVPYLRENLPPDVGRVIVSPDAGGAERARGFAERLEAGLAIVDKRRNRPNESEVMHIIGDVADRVVLIVDDMIDTAGTLVGAAQAVRQAGALQVYAAAAHGVLSEPACGRIQGSVLEQVVVTDSVPLGQKALQSSKVHVVSIAGLLGDAIRNIHHHDSVSRLFL